LRTIVVEVGERHRLPELFRVEPGEEIALRERLWSSSIDPDRATLDWLAALTGRISARMLAASSSFQYLAAAAPGAKELVTMREVLELCERSARRSALRDGEVRRYDLVVLDAPATGHALAMLHSPQTLSAIARVGPLATQAHKVQEALEDRGRCAYVAVAQASDMAVSETLELDQQLQRALGRNLDAVIVNGVLPKRFTSEEVARIAELESTQSASAQQHGGEAQDDERTEGAQSDERTSAMPVMSAALRSARAEHMRARMQQSQIARLRRRLAAGHAPPVLTIPFQFVPELDLDTVERIVDLLDVTKR
jgi:anion-transporting  ArsA/GET3 family ATPase